MNIGSGFQMQPTPVAWSVFWSSAACIRCTQVDSSRYLFIFLNSFFAFLILNVFIYFFFCYFAIGKSWIRGLSGLSRNNLCVLTERKRENKKKQRWINDCEKEKRQRVSEIDKPRCRFTMYIVVIIDSALECNELVEETYQEFVNYLLWLSQFPQNIFNKIFFQLNTWKINN